MGTRQTTHPGAGEMVNLLSPREQWVLGLHSAIEKFERKRNRTFSSGEEIKQEACTPSKMNLVSAPLRSFASITLNSAAGLDPMPC